MQNVVTFKQPKFKPLPGELTPAVINGATLPVKVEAAKRAIAACCDLSELLTWKDKLAALAAAAKMARMPEMARDVNRVHKEAIFRMGEILSQYNGEPVVKKGHRRVCRSERTLVGIAAGIQPSAASRAVRLSQAPKDIRERILADDRIPAHVTRMSRLTPRMGNPRSNQSLSIRDTDAAAAVFSGISPENRALAKTGNLGLNAAIRALRTLDISLISQLTPEEKQRARKYVVEMQEILDEIDRHLGAAS